MDHAAMGHAVLHGDLLGHVFPGVAYLLWALLWTRALVQGGDGSAPLATAGWLEARLMVGLPLLGIIGEARWLTFPMTDASLSIYQHVLAYLSAIVAGGAALLVARGALPRGADRFALGLAFAVPALVFGLHGHQPLVALGLHLVLAALLAGTTVLVALEQWSAAPALRWARVGVVLLVGSWFLQTGWMLYVAEYDLTSAAVVARVGLFFAAHVFGVGVVLLALVAVTHRQRTANRSPAPELRAADAELQASSV